MLNLDSWNLRAARGEWGATRLPCAAVSVSKFRDVLLRLELLSSESRMRPGRSPFLRAIFDEIFEHALHKANLAFKCDLRRPGRARWPQGRRWSLQALVGALECSVGA